MGNESASLISSHAMRLGFYSINLGTKVGQKLHTVHMLVLPIIPIIILLGQSSNALWELVTTSDGVLEVQTQVRLSKNNFGYLHNKNVQDIRLSNCPTDINVLNLGPKMHSGQLSSGHINFTNAFESCRKTPSVSF